ncbi:hypothetical protein KQI42_19945 [Tissierella sp. MSJ-40]|uniref:Uncharacterized protein n=1 Tax=Tissierella simiarum TaxID=2841534 RepID=A0ABS6EBH0_9FIRM|nr:hypothetical protein [Tissierella simiarum]MBU5440270.1 hypothetical protein [Tissierella simiarum]
MSSKENVKYNSFADIPKHYFLTVFGMVFPYILPYISIARLSTDQRYVLGISICVISTIVFMLCNYNYLNNLMLDSYKTKFSLKSIQTELTTLKDATESISEDNKALRAENLELQKIIQNYHLKYLEK